MRRSQMPPRRKPLRTRTRLVGGVLTHRRSAPSRAWTILRLQVLARSGGLCECCGCGLNPLAWECHHRRLRSQGGLDAMVNLLALTPACHQRTHRGDRAAAERAGLIVPSWQYPARVPVLLHGVDRMYLAGFGYAPAMDDEGGRCAAPDGGDTDA